MELETDKLCVDCKHSSRHLDIPNDKEYYRCDVKAYNAVVGGFGEPTCDVSRLSPYLCGPVGRYYERKEPF